MKDDDKIEVVELVTKHIGDEKEELATHYAMKIFDHASKHSDHKIFHDVTNMMHKYFDDDTYMPEKTVLLDAYEHIRECIMFYEEMVDKIRKDKTTNAKIRVPILKAMSEHLQAAKDADEMLKYAMKLTYQD